jgi:hypothetical protein
MSFKDQIKAAKTVEEVEETLFQARNVSEISPKTLLQVEKLAKSKINQLIGKK